MKIPAFKLQIAMILGALAISASAETLDVSIAHKGAPDKSYFRIDLERGVLTKINRAEGQHLEPSDVLKVVKRKVMCRGVFIASAGEILFQGRYDGTVVAVVRREFNSFRGLREAFGAMIGHPVQVSVISLVVVDESDCNKIIEAEMLTQASHHSWVAEVLSQQVP